MLSLMHREGGDDAPRDCGRHKAIALGSLAHGSSANLSYAPVIAYIDFYKAPSYIKEIDGNNVEKSL